MEQGNLSDKGKKEESFGYDTYVLQNAKVFAAYPRGTAQTLYCCTPLPSTFHHNPHQLLLSFFYGLSSAKFDFWIGFFRDTAGLQYSNLRMDDMLTICD
eukprot:CAMPEP_0113891160 /NCGR_PEP_ID=MMETSP0780_2-20120614/14589_1 /TAXON_ID=652834 /ORGANISM="Palpitomonas bilix" /LENGTH=98 /DNA_ID=CAMNT_0000880721 /DNA_START=419 /DNA_END=715 /DNA_ORIENTATION=- /assembly_acc=CAM_ASM_000599